MERRLAFALAIITALGSPRGMAAADEEKPRPKSEPRRAGPEGGHWGVLQGRVVFGGEPPAPRVIADPEERITQGTNHHGEVMIFKPPQRLKDFEVMAKRGGPILSERFLVDLKTKGVRNALVYLVKPTTVRNDARRAAPKTVEFREDRGVFVPHVLAAMQGANIVVSTEDPLSAVIRVRIPGTVFLVAMNDSSLAEPRVDSFPNELNYVYGNSTRDGRRVSVKLRVTPQAGAPIPVPVHEEIHNWMSGWWLVLDHPYFAVTDEQGNFAIRDVPTGPQQVVVWHESLDERGTWDFKKPQYVFQAEIVIQDGSATVKDFVIEPSRVRPGR